MDIVTDVLIRFPIIAQRSKGMHYFHRVVGLMVINIRQWIRSQDDICIAPLTILDSSAEQNKIT